MIESGIMVIMALVVHHISGCPNCLRKARQVDPGSGARSFKYLKLHGREVEDTGIIFQGVDFSIRAWDHDSGTILGRRFYPL